MFDCECAGLVQYPIVRYQLAMAVRTHDWHIFPAATASLCLVSDCEARASNNHQSDGLDPLQSSSHCSAAAVL